MNKGEERATVFNLAVLPQINNIKSHFNAILVQIEDKNTEEDVFTDSFPLIMKKSFLITIYSILEKELSKVTQFAEFSSNSTLKINDLRHRGIFRDYNYLTKVIGIKLPSDVWKKIRTYNRIRNFFIHEIKVVLTFKEVQQLSNKSVPFIEFKSSGDDRYVIKDIGSEIIYDFLETVEIFLKSVWIALEEGGHIHKRGNKEN